MLVQSVHTDIGVLHCKSALFCRSVRSILWLSPERNFLKKICQNFEENEVFHHLNYA